MSATSFGGSFELTRSDDTKLRNAFKTRMMKSALDTQLPWLKYLPFAPSPKSPEMDELIATIVSKRRKAMQAGEEKKDLLQIFLDAHDAHPEEFTEKHIYDEMRLFMIAGSDTTSSTATFTLIQLLGNPEKLKLLLKEIDTAFPSIEGEITFAATQNLSYLNACINESMRVMPIVRTGVPRIAEQPILLDGYEIPSGVQYHFTFLRNYQLTNTDASNSFHRQHDVRSQSLVKRGSIRAGEMAEWRGRS